MKTKIQVLAPPRHTYALPADVVASLLARGVMALAKVQGDSAVLACRKYSGERCRENKASLGGCTGDRRQHKWLSDGFCKLCNKQHPDWNKRRRKLAKQKRERAAR